MPEISRFFGMPLAENWELARQQAPLIKIEPLE